MDTNTVERRFDGLARDLVGIDDVSVGSGRGFGSGTLQVNGRIFAMVTHGQFVVKLPSARVAELIAVGDCSPFDAGKGKPMKEWAVVGEHCSDAVWQGLAKEALSFVSK
jgi:hypothetical protein